MCLHSAICHQTFTRPRPIGCDLGDCLSCVLFAWPDATLRPVLFYCDRYFVYCDRLTACASRDLVAYLPDRLAGFSRVSRVSPIWSSFLSSWLKSPITWPPLLFTPHLHTLLICLSYRVHHPIKLFWFHDRFPHSFGSIIICVSHHPRVLSPSRDSYIY